METLDDSSQESHIPQAVVNDSRSTAPWIKFVAIVGIVINVITLLISISTGTVSQISGSLIAVGISVALYLTLLSYGNSLGNFGISSSENDFTVAMMKQKSFWKFYGILFIVGLIVFMIALIIIVSVGGNFDQVFQQML